MAEIVREEYLPPAAKSNLGRIAIEVVGKDALLVASSIEWLPDITNNQIFGEGLSPPDSSIWRKTARLLEGIHYGRKEI